jgi:hypothetical protein
MKNKVVYIHRNPNTLEVFYVGQGSLKRAYRVGVSRGERYFSYVSKFGDPIIEIYKDGLSREESLVVEVELISKFGRIVDGTGTLINLDFGDSKSLETRQKIGQGAKGRSAPNKGVSPTIETRKKMSKNKCKVIRYEGVVYESIKNASEVLNIDRSYIARRCERL